MRASLLSAIGLAALAACADMPNTPPAAARVVAFPDRLVMYVGDEGGVAGQVLDGRGQVLAGAEPAYASEDVRVASVSHEGKVLAIAPGATDVVVSYAAVRAVVPVTVRADQRGALTELDLLPQVVDVDARSGAPAIVPFRAVDGLGRSICDRVPLTITANQALVRVENHILGPLACELWLTHLSAGESTISLASGALADSLRLRVVSSGYNAFFVARSPNVRAGDVVVITARVLDPAGHPIPNRRVSFSATIGTVSPAYDLTDSSGSAAMLWTPPTHLRYSGSYAMLTLRSELPNGVVAVDSQRMTLKGAEATRIHFFGNQGELVGRTVVSHQSIDRFIAAATDRFGNATAEISMTPNGSFACSDFSIVGVGPPPLIANPTSYSWCYAWVYTSQGINRLVARSGALSDTLTVDQYVCGRFSCNRSVPARQPRRSSRRLR